MRKIKKKGFTLIETMLAISIFTSAVLIRTQFEYDYAQDVKAHNFGKSMSELVSAFDKRVWYDGYVGKTKKPDGTLADFNWNKQWDATEFVLDTMIRQELNGFENKLCGDAILGWKPINNNVNDKSLYSCSKLSSEAVPFNFQLTSKRESLVESGNNIIQKWYVLAYHDTDFEFEKNWTFYSSIVEGFRTFDTSRLTGSHDAYFVDRTDPELKRLSSVSECKSIQSNCAIMFSFNNSKTQDGSDDPYLAVDGDSQMFGNFFFKTLAGKPTVCLDTEGKEKSCGLELGKKRDSLGLNTHKLTASDVNFVAKATNGNPIGLRCIDGVSVSGTTLCGFTVVNNEASGYFSEIFTKALIAKTFEVGSPIKINDLNLSNKSYNVVSHDKISHNNTAGELSYIKFETPRNSVEIGINNKNAGNITLNSKTMKSEATKYNLKKNLELSTANGNGIDLQINNRKLLTATNISEPINPNDRNIKSAPIATLADIFNTNRVVGINVVRAGVGVAKEKCRKRVDSGIVDNGMLKVIAIPSSGIHTNFTGVGDICKTNGNQFISYFFGEPNTTGNNVLVGNQGYDSFDVNVDWHVSFKCDPNRDTAVQYNVTERSGKWVVNYGIWGGGKYASAGTTPNGRKTPNTVFTVVQYCEYRK